MDGNRDDYAGRWQREIDKRLAEAETGLQVTKKEHELTVKHIQEGLTEIKNSMEDVRIALSDGGKKFTELSGKIQHLTECTMTCDDFNKKMESFMEGRTKCQAAVAKEIKGTNDKIDAVKSVTDRHVIYFQIISVVVAFIGTGFLGLFGQFMGWWFRSR